MNTCASGVYDIALLIVLGSVALMAVLFAWGAVRR